MRPQAFGTTATLVAMSESQTPNPFSREGSQPTDGLGADPRPRELQRHSQYQSPGGGPNDPRTADWPSYPARDPYGRPTADPYGMPGDSYGSPSANSMYAGPAHGFNPGPAPPYADPSQSYGQSSGYGSIPYEANPYQPAFGGVTPYGVMPNDATPHDAAPTGNTGADPRHPWHRPGGVLRRRRTAGDRRHRRWPACPQRDRRGARTLHRSLPSCRRDRHRDCWSVDLRARDGAHRARCGRRDFEFGL